MGLAGCQPYRGSQQWVARCVPSDDPFVLLVLLLLLLLSGTLAALYTPEDFPIGGEATVHGHTFLIEDADSFTKRSIGLE
jgi:hypothetical protein